MIITTVCKADYLDVPSDVSDGQIIIEMELPERSQTDQMIEDAEAIYSVLQQTLPRGTLDNLLILFLKRQMSRHVTTQDALIGLDSSKPACKDLTER